MEILKVSSIVQTSHPCPRGVAHESRLTIHGCQGKGRKICELLNHSLVLYHLIVTCLNRTISTHFFHFSRYLLILYFHVEVFGSVLSQCKCTTSILFVYVHSIVSVLGGIIAWGGPFLRPISRSTRLQYSRRCGGRHPPSPGRLHGWRGIHARCLLTLFPHFYCLSLLVFLVFFVHAHCLTFCRPCRQAIMTPNHIWCWRFHSEDWCFKCEYTYRILTLRNGSILRTVNRPSPGPLDRSVAANKLDVSGEFSLSYRLDFFFSTHPISFLFCTFDS